MEEEQKCNHCDDTGICKQGTDLYASCPECREASELDMAYYKGPVPCAVCKGKKVKTTN